VEIASSQPQHQALQTSLLITGGFIGSIFLVLTGLRGFITFVGVAGLLVGRFKQNSQDALIPQEMIPQDIVQ
jgi:hypothetical protein